MESDSSFQQLAMLVALNKATPEKIRVHGFKLKPGKTFSDVLDAKKLKPEQRIGGLDEIIYHVVENLKLTVSKIKIER